MEPALLVLIIVAVMGVMLVSLLVYLNMPGRSFMITFSPQHRAKAVRTGQNSNPAEIAYNLGFTDFAPTIFLSGGAAGFAPEDMERTREIIEAGLARFAEENGARVIDGGTDSGLMQMVAEARLKRDYRFPLIGIAPEARVSYPGYENPQADAQLKAGHSHFVLVDAPDWGDESDTLVRLTYTLAGAGKQPAFGILINGGQISKQDVFLATTQEMALPIIVLEGSGRFADELATAKRTGRTDQSLLRAIVEGGDIHLIATDAGPEGLRNKMSELMVHQMRKKNKD